MKILPDIIQSLIEPLNPASTADNGSDAQCQFDLQKENINGVFSNLTLLSMLLMSVSKGSKCSKPKQTRPKSSYDYIIVGGGSAGSVMASRLSEKPCVNVLLLEAGGYPPLLTEVPAYNTLFLFSELDWRYKTTPQKYSAFSHKGNIVNLSSGKVLGGSSAIGAMQYVRGNKATYDQWVSEGATGWGYKQVLPYFLKLEDNRNITGLDEGYHNVGGPMTVEMPKYTPEIKDPLIQATKAMGYEVLDVNGQRQTGIYDIEATVRNQQRCSTKKGYLDPASDRRNLHILVNAFVVKILINEEKVAYGVQFEYDGANYTVSARREVILSNGAIRTPQLLMLSGIGPRKHLKKFNIPVVRNLPAVGKNLQDHVSSYLMFTVNETITPVAQKISNPVNIGDYIARRNGPLTAPNQVTLISFANGSKSINSNKPSTGIPKLEMWYLESDVRFIRSRSLKKGVYEETYQRYEGKPLYKCSIILLQPLSRGDITLNSTDCHAMPNINPNYYKDERDLQTVVEGAKICNATANHPAMKQVNAQHITTSLPACKKLRGNDDPFYRCSIREVVASFWQFSGTARMGDPNNRSSVVDPQLRVIGVKGLRVVSAAVFPIIPSGDTNIPTIMVAEKAYDLMKDDVKCR